MPRKKLPPAVPIMRVVTQREPADCGVACLAMHTGCTYEDALRAVCRVDEDGAGDGLFVPQIIKAASELGVALKKKRRVDLHIDSGILHVRFRSGKLHVVMLLPGGMICDTDGTFWVAEDYLRAQKARVNAVLVDAA